MGHPWSNQYQNQFEKEYYMAVNVFRKQPDILVTFFKDLKQMNFPSLSSQTGKDALTTAILKVQ